LKKLDV